VFVAQDRTPGAFVEVVRSALAVPAWKKEAGPSFTRQYSWESRAERLLQVLGRAR